MFTISGFSRYTVFTILFGSMGVAGAQTRFADDYRPEPAFAAQTRAALADQSPRLIISVLSDAMEVPYGIDFLPDGRLIVTEQVGRIRIVDTDGNLSLPIDGLPELFSFRAYGLNDITLDPDFETNRLLYFVYTPPPEVSTEGMEPDQIQALITGKIARARLSENERTLEDVRVVFDALARRLVFAPDGTLFFTVMAALATRELAQNLSVVDGKVLRINADGSIPGDNPFVGVDDVHPAIYSLGHRDPTGAAFHPETGELWTVEHGPRGGDELNIIRPGENYGWPVITYGREYSAEPIGNGITEQEGMEQPVYFWTPSIAPGSLMFYQGDKIPEWSGNAFVSTLSGEHLARLVLDGERVVEEERLFVGREQRIRTVAQGPDGNLYMSIQLFEGGGQLLRISGKSMPNRIGSSE